MARLSSKVEVDLEKEPGKTKRAVVRISSCACGRVDAEVGDGYYKLI